MCGELCSLPQTDVTLRCDLNCQLGYWQPQTSCFDQRKLKQTQSLMMYWFADQRHVFCENSRDFSLNSLQLAPCVFRCDKFSKRSGSPSDPSTDTDDTDHQSKKHRTQLFDKPFTYELPPVRIQCFMWGIVQWWGSVHRFLHENRMSLLRCSL